jgi:hypothetical protein
MTNREEVSRFMVLAVIDKLTKKEYKLLILKLSNELKKEGR